MSSAITSMFTQRCPQCGEGKLFKGVYEMHDVCSSCGVRFYRDPGAWTGATVLTYVATSVFALVVLILLWANGTLAHGGEFIMLGSVTVFSLLALRFVKAFWVGLLFDSGYVTADPPPPEEHS